MTKQVYVGNLSLDTTPDTLRSAFSRDGQTVLDVVLVKSPKTGRSRGFGFVEMETDEQVQAVIRDLDGTVIDGRPIKVGEGKERPEFEVRAPVDRFARRGGGNKRGRR